MALLEAGVAEVFSRSGGALGAMADSFDKKRFTGGQMEQLRALGLLALTVNMTPLFEQCRQTAQRTGHQHEEVAKDLNDDAQTAARMERSF